MFGVLIACVLAVFAALVWRLSRTARDIPRARRAAVTLARMPAPAAPASPGLAGESGTGLVTAGKTGQR
jgi:uncharacterized membrane protein YccC